MSEEEKEISSALPEAAPAVRRERGKASAHTGGFFDRTAQFLRDTRAEMRRVSWPSFSMVKNTTVITLVAVIFFAIYLFLVDQGWARFIGCDGQATCGGRVTGLNWLVSKLFG